MNISELLPIGSVVMLAGGEKRLMIYGIMQTEECTNKEYDYIGVIYPEGNLGKEGHFLFNTDDIEKVCFIGLNDSERQAFIKNLERFYQSRGLHDADAQ